MSVYLSLDVNFTFSFFLGDKLPINMKMLVFFLAKCVRTTVKTMVVDRKKQKALALLYLASKPLQKAVNSSSVPTEFTTELFAWTLSPHLFCINWTFCLPQKDNRVFLWTFLLYYQICFWLSLCLFCYNAFQNAILQQKNTGFSTGLYPVYATSYWWSCGADRRTDGRAVTWLLRHYQHFLAW